MTDLAGRDPMPMTSSLYHASNGIWSPDGKRIAFVMSVYPEFSEKPFAESGKLNRDRDDEIAKSPVKAKTFTKLFYRHWNAYVGDKRQHIFVIDADTRADRAGHPEPRDVTPGDRDAFPTSSTFDSGDNFTFSPDSKHIVFTAPPAENEAWSTNYDLCRVRITNTSTKWETLTKDNKAADSGPKFSADGKKLAWRAQAKAGYEADKWSMVVRACNADGTLAPGEPVAIKDPVGVSVTEFVWLGSYSVFGLFEKDGASEFFQASFVGTEENRKLTTGFYGVRGMKSHYTVATQPGAPATATFLVSRAERPPEVVAVSSDPERDPVIVTNHNDKLLNERALFPLDAVQVPVEGDVKMHMWIATPPGFDAKAGKKWPVVYLVHGGPQSAWRDVWNYRWNVQLWAAQGYVVAMPNPRGSAGFGQKFQDEITGDWGGKCYRDLVAGLDFVEKLPYVDKDRIAAAGGSFGGYMVNWFAVNDIAKRFKCLVTHCSVWNFESMWGTTDELWFDEWEHGGLPWEQPKKYAQFSPHKRAGELKKHKTPMLVIHNDLDFRCPIGQGHELFTALQRNGVPNRFVNFPDEGHHVLKPKNSEHWHKEVFAWLKKHAPPGGK